MNNHFLNPILNSAYSSYPLFYVMNLRYLTWITNFKLNVFFSRIDNTL